MRLKRALTGTLVALSLVIGLIVPTYAARPTTLVYDNAVDFRIAIAASHTGRAAENMSEEAKQARRQAIAKAVGKIDIKDRAGLEDVARQYGLIIYNPNLVENEIQPLSNSGDISISKPTITYDTITWERGFNGVAQWNNWEALWGDTPIFGSNLGGPDRAGLSFSNITQPSKLTSWWLYSYDSRGNLHCQNFTRDLADQPDNRFTVQFACQDTWLGTDRGYATVWKVDTWVWAAPDFTDTGDVMMSYAHDWKDTSLSSIGFNTSGSGTSDKKVTVGFGLTFTWNLSTEKWAGGSLYAQY